MMPSIPQLARTRSEVALHARATGSYIVMSADDAAALRQVALHHTVAGQSALPAFLRRALAADAGDPAELRVEALRVRAASRIISLPLDASRHLADPRYTDAASR
jgi:hypothetical protein